MKFVDIIGTTYGEWKVIGRDMEATTKQTKWICECSCGTVKSVNGHSLKNGKSTSCGKCGSKKSEVLFDIPEGFIKISYCDSRYAINMVGEVFNLTNGKLMKPSLNAKGYSQVVMVDNNGNRITRKVHRLVAETFIENPYGKPTVNHIDGNKANNHISNLEWNTYSENQQHAYDTGLCPKNKNKISLGADE